MVYNYTCSVCGMELSHDDRSDLIEMVQDRAADEHDVSMKRTDIRGDITEN